MINNFNRLKQWKNLALDLVRQRLVIEGTTQNIVEPDEMRKYLIDLAEITDMEVVNGPYVYSAHEMGYGGWIHWKSSGTHIYSYPTDPPLFTVDTYTCKPFNIENVVNFTKDYFDALEIVFQEVRV